MEESKEETRAQMRNNDEDREAKTGAAGENIKEKNIKFKAARNTTKKK